MKNNKALELAFIISGAILCLASIFIYALDKNFALRWLVLVFWLGGVMLSMVPATISFLKNKPLLKNKHEFLFIVLLVFIAGFLRLYKITEIPLLSGDEARDAGFLPETFLRGKIKDFFGYGVYGIPNIFIALSSIPHFLFGHSILAVRFFSAFFGTLAVVLVYFLARECFGKKIGMVSAILMSCYHVHLHFSRSEFINNFDSFWAPLVIILLFKAIMENSYRSLLFGLSLGMVSHFYQGIRAILFFSAIYFLTWNLMALRKYFKTLLVKTGYLLLGLFLGLGPSIVVLVTRPSEFLNTGTAGGPLFFSLGILEFIKLLPNRLLHSFGALIYYPINFHYRYGGPFLKFPLSLFFIIGIFFILRNFLRKEHNIFLFWISFVIFCNSTLLEGLNYTHRLLSIVPALMIVTGIGIINLAKIFKEKTLFNNLIVFLFISISVFLNLKSYFFDSIWKNAYDINTKVATIAGYYTAGFPTRTKFYFLNSPRMGWKSGPSWEYIAPSAQVEDFEEVNLQSVLSMSTGGKERFVFIALPERTGDLKIIERVWPGGYKKDHYYDNELLFITYELK